jgi:hypothetical protein
MQEFDSYYAAIESAKQLATEKKPEQFLVYANRNRNRFFVVAESDGPNRDRLGDSGCNLSVYYYVRNGRLLGYAIGS